MAEIDINVQAVIAASASLSAQADIGNKVLVGLILPAAWSAAAGGISLQGSVDGGSTWGEVYTAAGSPYVIDYVGAGGTYLAIDPNVLRGISSYRVRSGTAAAPVDQTDQVSVSLVTRLVF